MTMAATLPAILLSSTGSSSNPMMNSNKTTPMAERSLIVTGSLTQPSTYGPAIMPAIICAETTGSLNRAKIRLKMRAKAANIQRSSRNVVVPLNDIPLSIPLNDMKTVLHPFVAAQRRSQ